CAAPSAKGDDKFITTDYLQQCPYSYHSYQSEIFPTHIRARAVGFCYSFSRLSTVFSSIIIGIILQYGGSLGVIAFIVASMLIVMLVIGLFGPKTRGIDLENI
ncbi:MFS transporter, partial [Serratia marcescens]|uniref:MFS transporter n=1 Tax=Serratia marcescens TaxID=615 RepID=UPI001F157017